MNIRALALQLVLITGTLTLTGCLEGDKGEAGATGPTGPGGNELATTTTATSLSAVIDSVDVSAGTPVVDFTVRNEYGVRFVGLAATNMRFNIAKLIPESNGDASAWQNYINFSNAGAGDAGAIMGSTENTGTLLDNGDGSYTYTFLNDITNITAPVAVSYEPTSTHRLSLQIFDNRGTSVTKDDLIANAIYTWRPSDGATTGIATRDIVKTESCNECHTDLVKHGARKDTRYCVTCHYAGNTDGDTGNSLDFKVLLHKLHMGRNLPSVQADISGGNDGMGIYYIGPTSIGGVDRRSDFGNVRYPQDIRNCVKCHDAADADTPQGGNWETVPTIEACGSCHEDVDFATGTNHSGDLGVGGPQADNQLCANCHGPTGSVATIAASHADPRKTAQAKYQFNIISVTGLASGTATVPPGDLAVVKFSVTNPSTGAFYKVNANDTPDRAFSTTVDLVGPPTYPAGAGGLTMRLSWSTTDIDNSATGKTGPFGFNINLRTAGTTVGASDAVVANGDGTYTATFENDTDLIPASVTGSGMITIEGWASEDLDGNGTVENVTTGTNSNDRVPIAAAIAYFPITDTAAEARRQVVDYEKCNVCHNGLAPNAHRKERAGDPRLCTQCHNPDFATSTTATVPNVPLHYKRLIHAIHASEFRENAFTVNTTAANPRPAGYGSLRFPGLVNQCEICHVAATSTKVTYGLPLPDGARSSTTDIGADASSFTNNPADDIKISPAASVCSSCHDSALAQLHMEQNGGRFDLDMSNPSDAAISVTPNTTETCELCHGTGDVADVRTMHHID